MERVFIIDPDTIHAALLRLLLESFGYQVAACEDERSVLEPIKENGPDLLVVVPRSPVTLQGALESARLAVKNLERQPELLFVLRWTQRGPADRLLGDRWNVQVLYER
jgi:CheY-like chemotaxis protein